MDNQHFLLKPHCKETKSYWRTLKHRSWNYSLRGTIETDYHHSLLTHQGRVLPFSIIVIASPLIKCSQLLCNRKCFINNCAGYHGKVSFSIMPSQEIHKKKEKKGLDSEFVCSPWKKGAILSVPCRLANRAPHHNDGHRHCSPETELRYTAVTLFSIIYVFEM